MGKVAPAVEFAREKVEDDFLPKVDPCTRSYAASFYAGGIACVARRYAQEGCSSDASQLESLLMTLLSGRLF